MKRLPKAVVDSGNMKVDGKKVRVDVFIDHFDEILKIFKNLG